MNCAAIINAKIVHERWADRLPRRARRLRWCVVSMTVDGGCLVPAAVCDDMTSPCRRGWLDDGKARCCWGWLTPVESPGSGPCARWPAAR